MQELTGGLSRGGLLHHGSDDADADLKCRDGLRVLGQTGAGGSRSNTVYLLLSHLLIAIVLHHSSSSSLRVDSGPQQRKPLGISRVPRQPTDSCTALLCNRLNSHALCGVIEAMAGCIAFAMNTDALRPYELMHACRSSHACWIIMR